MGRPKVSLTFLQNYTKKRPPEGGQADLCVRYPQAVRAPLLWSPFISCAARGLVAGSWARFGSGVAFLPFPFPFQIRGWGYWVGYFAGSFLLRLCVVFFLLRALGSIRGGRRTDSSPEADYIFAEA